MTPPLTAFLITAGLLLAIGVFGVLTSRNLIRLLMALEVVLNAVTVNYVAFAAFVDPGALQGHSVAIFIITVIAAETGLAIAILLALFRRTRSASTDTTTTLKG